MNDIFKELDNILNSVNEAEEPEKKVKEIPIHPDMKTAIQGKMKAMEQISQYFYNLEAKSKSGKKDKIEATDEIELPSTFIDPIMKGKMDNPTDKKFEENSLIWDNKDEMEKLKKEVDVDIEDSDSEFDDFDYKDNEFADTDTDMDDLDMDSSKDSGGSGSSKSEKDKLKDAIKKAIDDIKDKKSGSESKGGSKSSEKGGESGGTESGEDGGESSGESEGSSTGGSTSTGGSPSTKSAKDSKLDELSKALDSEDSESFDKISDSIKEGESGSGKLAGETRDKVSDDEFKKEMKEAGFSDKDIEEMSKIKNDDTDDMSKDEFDKLKKDVIEGLEKKCKKKGGSALAKTVIKHALHAKIDNEEWRKLLEMFLDAKSINGGESSRAKDKTIWGHKNHLWRDAVLPTTTWGDGEIQKVTCFIDFSGSVNQDLVYTFLGKVIDLCMALSYTEINVYGFSERITLPRKINGKTLKKDGKEVTLSQTWDFIQSQNPGYAFENFEAVAHTINQIRRKEHDSVFLIFGDGLWATSYNNPCPPIYLKDVCGKSELEHICVLTYYTYPNDSYFAAEIAYLKEIVGLKNVITTKATSLRGE